MPNENFFRKPAENPTAKFLSPEETAYYLKIPEKLLSEKEAAEFLGISKITLQRKRKVGEIDFYQIGSRILYHPDHLAAYLAKCEQKAER